MDWGINEYVQSAINSYYEPCKEIEALGTY